MRQIKTQKSMAIPDGVSVTIKTRTVTVKGPRGTLSRSFSHLAIDLFVEDGGRRIRAELWFGNRQSIACIRTVLSHINNMVVGVTKGFLFKMRLVYNHFPISITMERAGQEVQVRNYLGEKRVRVIPMIGDVVAKRSEDGTKDEIILSGNDLDAVSQSAANIWSSSRCKDKDIRKYLDGVYVSYRGHVVQEE